MHFAFTDEQAMIAETVSAFFAEHATSERTRGAMASREGIDPALWQSFSTELGLAGIQLPEEFGGASLGHVELAIVAEAAGRHVAALPLVASIALAAPAILAGGSPPQRTNWLPRLASGERIATVAGLEPGASLRCDGGRLAGLSPHVPHGQAADLFVIAAGGDLYLVERDAPGLVVEPLVSMDQTRPYARLTLRDVVGERLEDGERGIAAATAAGCIVLAADALGGAQACLDRTVAYVNERVQFGRTIGSFQAVKHRLADMMVEVEQARSAVYWAACARDEEDAGAALAMHAAKAFATDAYQMCAGNMIQLHGGIGFTWEHDAHLYFKRARADATLLGTPAWHREQIAQLIGLDEAA